MAAEPLWPTYLHPSDVSTSIGGVEVWVGARTYGLGWGSNPRPTVPQHSALNRSTIPARSWFSYVDQWRKVKDKPSLMLSPWLQYNLHCFNVNIKVMHTKEIFLPKLLTRSIGMSWGIRHYVTLLQKSREQSCLQWTNRIISSRKEIIFTFIK